MVTTGTQGPKHGLYLANSPGYCGDLATPKHVVEYAVAAEEAGWDGVFMADAFGSAPHEIFIDPWTTYASIAVETDHITLGSYISPVPRHQPWQLALNLATLDHLSDGRVLFGGGLGAPHNYETIGHTDSMRERGERYDEALDILTELWTGEPVTYDGQHFDIENLQLPVTPLQEPRIPLVLGFWWPNKKPIHRAAEWDGIMPFGPSFYGEEGVQGEPVTGTPKEEVRGIMEYYLDHTDEPGEVVFPIDIPEADDDFADFCEDMGATWLLSISRIRDDGHEANLERIHEGPPV